MALTPIAVESFAGLNLTDDPGTVGWGAAIDCLNVDLDRRGRVRSRDGYAKFTTAAAAGAYHALAPFYTTSGTKQLIGAFGGGSGAINALNTSGGIVAAQSAANSTYASIARHAAPGSEHAYVAASGTGAGTVYRWNGSAWSTPTWTGTTPTGRHLAVEASDNRLVCARYNGSAAGDNPSTVRFSDPGIPTTWGANNYVDFSPGDGEEIMALVAWHGQVFAFKQTKFTVFFGTSEDSSGNPIFNQRPAESQGLAGGAGGTAYRAVCVAPNGIYFANRRGIWSTQGNGAQLVSRKVDPIFRGDVEAFGPSALNQAAIDQCALLWHDEKLWFAYPSGSATTNDRILRFDPVADAWTLYDMPASAMASFRIGNAEEFVFCFSGGSTVNLSPPASPAAAQATNASTLTTNTTYYYKITALNAAGETTPSTEVSATTRTAPGTPGTPTLVAQDGGSLTGGATYYYKIVAYNETAATASVQSFVTLDTEGNGSVRVSWTAASGTVTGYRVYRGVSSGTFVRYASVGSGTLTYTDWGGTLAGDAVPVTGDAKAITLTWTAVTGATGYRVYRGTSAGSENVYYAPGNVVTYTDTNAASTGGSPPGSNTATTAGFDIARHSTSYTSDGGNGTSTGAGIVSRYRSGFSDLGQPDKLKKTVRQWQLRGSGAVNFSVSADSAVPIPTTGGGAKGAVTLGDPGWYSTSQAGRDFSWQVESDDSGSAWTLNAAVALVLL